MCIVLLAGDSGWSMSLLSLAATAPSDDAGFNHEEQVLLIQYITKCFGRTGA